MLEQQLNNNDENQAVESVLDALRGYGRPPENGEILPSSSAPSVVEVMVSYGNKTLEEDAAKQEHARNQKWKNHFNTAFIIAFWFLWSCFILMVFALIFHWVMPDTWHWLKPEQLDKIKTVIMAALVSKAITNQQEKLSKFN